MSLPIKILITGDESGAVKAAKNTESVYADLGDNLKKSAIAIGAAFTAATAAATVFAKKSVDEFKNVASETRELQRLTGGTAETMSRLRFAGQQVGVSVDALGNGLKKLSKGMADTNKLTKETGIRFTDAKGRLLPLDKALENVAEKFKTMPDGVKKNQLAMQLFGKSGTDLIPILNKGRDGLKDLSAQADKYGLTLTQNNLDALKRNAQAHKELDAAMQGLKVQVGAALMPIMADLARLTADKVVPAFVAATNFVRQHFGPTFIEWFGKARVTANKLVTFIRDEAVPWITEKWKQNEPKFTSAWNTIKDAWTKAKEIVDKELIPALKNVWEWLENKLVPAAGDVAKKFKDELIPAIGGTQTIAGVLGVSAALVSLAQGLQGVRDAAQALMSLGVIGSLESMGVKGVALRVALLALVLVLGYVVTHLQETEAWLNRNKDAVLAVATMTTILLLPALGRLLVALAAQAASMLVTIQLWILYKMQAAAAALATALASARMIASFALLSAQATLTAIKTAIAWAINAAGAVASAAATVAAITVMVASWVLLGVQSLLAAAKVALAWLIALGPIGIVIAAVVALVALIIIHWDTIKRVTLALWSQIKESTSAAWSWIKDKVSDVVEWFAGVPNKISDLTRGMWDGIKDAFRSTLNWVIDKWNSLELKLPEVDTGIPGIGKIGGFTLSTPNIPMLAKGGTFKGLAVVGEQGRELVYSPTSAQVIPNGQTERLLAGRGSRTFAPVISIDARGSNMSEADWERLVDRKLMPALEKFIKEYEVEMEAR